MQNIGKYQIQKKIGSGGMGTVYLAFDEQLKRTVALKVLSKEKAENPILVKRFKSEAQSAARLKDKNIITVYEAGEATSRHYIAMEYFEGVDVHELVERHGVLSVKRSLDIIKKIAKALKHAQKQNIVHRDIKPSNIMISRKGEVKLTDMGLARIVDDEEETGITRAGTTVGTVDYMSPEQARNSRYADTRSDIYSLGCTWFHMLTGRPPFPEGGLTKKLYEHASGERPDPRDFNDKVPEGIVAIIYRMMAQKPEDRYQTPSELLEDLENANTTPDIGVDAIASAMTELAAEETSSQVLKPPPVDKKQATLPPRETITPESESESESDTRKPISWAVLGSVAGVVILFFAITAFFSSGSTPQPKDNVNRDVLQERIKGEEDPEEDKKKPVVKVTDTVPDDVPKEQYYPILKPVSEFKGTESVNLTIGKESEKTLFPSWVPRIWDGEVSPDLNPVRGLDVIKVGRNDRVAGNYENLDMALGNLGSKGTVIELLGKGPFILSSKEIKDAGQVVISGKENEKSVVILIKDSGAVNAPLIHLTQTDLVLDHIDLYYDAAVQESAPSSLFEIESGNFSFRRGNLTVQADPNVPVTAFRLSGETEKTGSGRASIPRVLLDRVTFLGKNLLPLDIDKDYLSLCASNSLFLTGNSPAIQLECSLETNVRPSKQVIYRDLKLFSCTFIPFENTFRFSPGVNPTNPPTTRIYSSHCIFGRDSGSGSSARLLEIPDWPLLEKHSPARSDAVNLRWFSDQSLFVNWNQLIQTKLNQPGTNNPSEDWINFWGSENLDTDPKQFQKVDWPEQSIPEPDRFSPGQFSNETLSIPVVKSSPDWSPGAESSLLSYNIARDLPVIEKYTRRNQFLAGLKQMKFPENDKIVKVDLNNSSQKDLGKFIASNAWEDGTVFEITGRGKHDSQEIEINDRSLEFRFVDTEANPFYIQPKLKSDEGEVKYLFNVKNGHLKITNGYFTVNRSRAQGVGGIIHVDQGGFTLSDSIIISRQDLSSRHESLIKWTGSEDKIENIHSSTGIIENSFLIAPVPVLIHEFRGSGLSFRNSILASAKDLINLNLENSNSQKVTILEMDYVTCSANRNFIQCVSLPLSVDEKFPVMLFVNNSVFAPGIETDDSQPDTSVCSIPEISINKQISWDEKNNGYSQTIQHFFAGFQAPEDYTASQFWIEKWGPSNISRLLYEPGGVALKTVLNELTDTLPEHFELDSNSKAVIWSTTGSSIGCEISKIPWSDYREMRKSKPEEEDSKKKKKSNDRQKNPKVQF